MESKEDRTEFARQVREYMSDVCRLVNKGHTLYRFREENDEVELPANLVRFSVFVDPQTFFAFYAVFCHFRRTFRENSDTFLESAKFWRHQNAGIRGHVQHDIGR